MGSLLLSDYFIFPYVLRGSSQTGFFLFHVTLFLFITCADTWKSIVLAWFPLGYFQHCWHPGSPRKGLWHCLSIPSLPCPPNLSGAGEHLKLELPMVGAYQVPQELFCIVAFPLSLWHCLVLGSSLSLAFDGIPENITGLQRCKHS